MKRNIDSLLLQKLDDLAAKVDEVRVKDLPEMRLETQQSIADIKLHVESVMTPIKVDVGGLKIKAAVAGGVAGILGTGLATFLIQLLHK